MRGTLARNPDAVLGVGDAPDRGLSAAADGVR